MSTVVKSCLIPSEFSIDLDGEPNAVAVHPRVDGEVQATITLPRADFLAAVAVECDAIVIPREELPGVGVDDGQVTAGVNQHRGRYIQRHDTPGGLVAEARALLALAEYLDAHPPVDQAQVEALAEVIREAQNLSSVPEVTRDLARRLLATGRIEVKP